MTAMVYALNDSDERVRAKAADEIGDQIRRNRCCCGAPVIRALTHSLADCDKRVRRQAEEALELCGYEIVDGCCNNCPSNQCCQEQNVWANTTSQPAAEESAKDEESGKTSDEAKSDDHPELKSVPAPSEPEDAPAPAAAPAPEPQDSVDADSKLKPRAFFPSRLRAEKPAEKRSGLSSLLGMLK